MSSIIKKTSARFTPKLTQRKQSRTGTPVPTTQKSVQIEETAQIIPNNDDEIAPDIVEHREKPKEAPPILKQNVFEQSKKSSRTNNEAIIDDDEDPKKKTSTVIINPTKLSTKSNRRSSSSANESAQFRRSSTTDDSRRMRRLSSITSGLGAGLGAIRRQSISGTSVTIAPPTSAATQKPPTRISISDIPEAYKIEIPTSAPIKGSRARTKPAPAKGSATKKRFTRAEVGDFISAESAVEDNDQEPEQTGTEQPNEEEHSGLNVTTRKRRRSQAVTFVPRKSQTDKMKKAIQKEESNAILKEPLEADTKLIIENGILRRQPVDMADEEVNTEISDLSILPKVLLKNHQNLFNRFKINENTITMEDLCKPIFPLGEVSENYELAEAAAENKAQQAAERKRLRLEAREKGVKYSELLVMKEEEGDAVKRANSVADNSEPTEVGGIQLKMSESGVFDVQQESLLVDRHNTQMNDDREKITENIFEKPVISSTYGRRMVTDKWTLEESSMLYNALSSWGTDFNIIAQLFPHRTRRQIKAKFNLEERKHPHIIEWALKRKLGVKFDEFCKQTKQSFKTIDEFDKELRELKDKHEAEVKNMLEAADKQRKEDAETQRKREVEKRTGIRSMSRAERRAELSKNETIIGEVSKKED